MPLLPKVLTAIGCATWAAAIAFAALHLWGLA